MGHHYLSDESTKYKYYANIIASKFWRGIIGINWIDNFVVMDARDRKIVSLRQFGPNVKPKGRPIGKDLISESLLNYFHDFTINLKTYNAESDKVCHLRHEREQRIELFKRIVCVEFASVVFVNQDEPFKVS